MKHNWVLIAAIIAVLAVPFGLALFEDATRDPALAGEPTSGPEEPEPAPEPAEPAADGVVEWERADPLDLGFIDAYLAPHEPGLRTELAGAVTFGEPISDLAQSYEARFNTTHDNQGLTLAIEAPAQLHGAGPVTSVTLRFPGSQKLYDRLEERWGAPLTRTSYDQPCAVWAGDDNPIRAVLDRSLDNWTLALGHHRSFEELLAPRADGSLGLEPFALIGAAIDDVKSRLGDVLVADEEGNPNYMLLVTPSVYSRRSTLPIELSTYAGEVIELSASIDMACDRNASSRALAFLTESFGGVAGSAQVGEAREVRFVGRPDISAFIYSDRVIMVRRARD